MSKENFNINESDILPSVNYQPTLKYLNNITDTYNLPEDPKNESLCILPNRLNFSSSKINLFHKPYHNFKLRCAVLVQGNPM